MTSPTALGVHVLVASHAAAHESLTLSLTEIVEASPHALLGVHLLDDDEPAVRGQLSALAADAHVDAVVVVGIAPEPYQSAFDTTLPGFAELARALRFPAVGARAALLSPLAGTWGRLVVFFVPEDGAGPILEALVMPLLPEVVEGPGLPVDGPRTGEDVHAVGEVTAATVEAPQGPQAPPPPEGEGPWQRAVRELGGSIVKGGWVEPPEALAKLAPVTSVFDAAGERAWLQIEDGPRLALYGYPDLRRPTSKVLAVGEGGPAEVVALHRWPHRVGTPGELGPVNTSGDDLETLTERVTGYPWREAAGTLFALDTDTVWLRQGGRVVRWDGRRAHDDGTPNQVLASLVLRWSQR